MSGAHRAAPAAIARALAALTLVLALVLAAAPGDARGEDLARMPARRGRWKIDCASPGHPISPLVYGIGTWFRADDPQQWTLGATARRWGGNAASRYNWELGDVWNLDHDWYFRNARVGGRPGTSYATFLAEDRAHGLRSALVVPMIGWVAKDATSCSFPVSVFGPQRSTAFDLPDAGDGLDPGGRPLRPGPPTRTSVPSTPESIGRWVARIRRDAAAGGPTVDEYILDNEPMLWHRTHRDVHPEPVSYDELLERTVAYATAIRRADPGAVIAGPASWGWLGYHYSARDSELSTRLPLDRLAHGGVPLLPWYLRTLRERERRTGVRLLDVLDVHFYPAIPAVGLGTSGAVDPAGAALRLRSTRSLWDASYRDESWIGERIRLLPLLREWVDENAPGLGISIGEWNFGAEGHMSGGLAVAEALGRFGQAGIDSAFYWTVPPDRSPAYWAFRAYRNFDGAGGRFLDVSAPVRGDGTLASLFASRDPARSRVVAILLNLDPRSPIDATIDLAGCGPAGAVRAFVYGGGPDGPAPVAGVAVGPDGALAVEAAPYTITILEVGPGAGHGR